MELDSADAPAGMSLTRDPANMAGQTPTISADHLTMAGIIAAALGEPVETVIEAALG